ncbi:peptide-methionine (S)-S-oxide reductase [Candidatus Bathyarchaeota archaeon]|nr:peptide-methionine (S)-S-oxide reductase [Candidatus Bathyarchaeota archaeon]
MSNKPGMNETKEVATLAGGCFWCTEAVFSIVKGVEKVEPGYSGGSVPNPTYDQVSSGTTGHAEAVQLTFDPSAISFREILEVFFATHDPTTLNRQGPDIGTQYRSVIFYHNPEQKTTAEKVIAELNKDGIWEAPIVTRIEPFSAFYLAEKYHRDYYKRNSDQPYCQQVITPKLVKLQQRFLGKLKV